MNKLNRMRTAALAAAVLGAAALTVGTDSAMAQMRRDSGMHSSFHSGGWHGTRGHFGTFRGGNWHGGTFRGGNWHGGTFRGAFNHRGWVWRGGRWWRGGVAVGFYGGYPYYGYPYGYGYDGYYPNGDYYGDSYDSCGGSYGDYDDEDCDD
jgi:hypothetical protein